MANDPGHLIQELSDLVWDNREECQGGRGRRQNTYLPQEPAGDSMLSNAREDRASFPRAVGETYLGENKDSTFINLGCPLARQWLPVPV
jgi:hypothetical protein